MKILLLEDNQTLNETITLKLELKGYKVSSYVNGTDAINNIDNGFTCFILDINVPCIDGVKILKKIRDYYLDIPVIIISATVELDIIKQSYDFGCNDYLKKPFFIDELEIKVDKLCKIPKNIIKFDENCFFNFEEKSLTINNKKNELTQKETLIMNLFLENKNTIVSYENIQNYVWEGEYTSLDAIRTLIKRLRKKLNKPYIKASSSTGYYFNINNVK